MSRISLSGRARPSFLPFSSLVAKQASLLSRFRRLVRFDFSAAFGFAVLLTESGALRCSVTRVFGRLGASRHSHPPVPSSVASATEDRRLRRDRRERQAKLSRRVSDVQRQLFQHAADLQGRSLTDFVIATVQKEAVQTIETMEIIRLNASESMVMARGV